jgi:hypothetical protein
MSDPQLRPSRPLNKKINPATSSLVPSKMGQFKKLPSNASGKNNYKMLVGGMCLGAFIMFMYLGPRDVVEVQPSAAVKAAVPALRALAPQPPKRDKDVNIIDARDGWKAMHVFYGATDIIPTIADKEEQEKTWQSQVGQDEMVFNMLGQKKGGYFIDLAANDPISLSNSYSLETHHGWNGLCIEGNPFLLDALSFRKCHVVGAVVSKDRLEKISYATRMNANDNRADLGGIVGAEMKNKEAMKNDVTVTKYTVPLLEIFEKFNVPKEVDYFSLDVEGAERMVLSSFPLDSYSFKILTVEQKKADAKELLESHGYVCLKKIAFFGETLWAKKSAIPELDLTVIGVAQELALSPGFNGCG